MKPEYIEKPKRKSVKPLAIIWIIATIIFLALSIAAEFNEAYEYTMPFATLSALALFIGAPVAIITVHKDTKEFTEAYGNYLKNNGIKVKAKFIKVKWLWGSDHYYNYKLICKIIHPKTGNVEIVTRYLHRNPSRTIKEWGITEFDTYIDPENSKIYHLDLDILKK